MSDRRIWLGGGCLILLTLLSVTAPWLGLRDPLHTEEDPVLADLPPLSRPHRVLLAEGGPVHAAEIFQVADGSLELRAGRRSWSLTATELAGPREADWHRRPFYLFGTDKFGRDLFSRLLYGGRVSLLIGLLAASMSLGLGTLIGGVAGMAGGWVDGLLMRFTDLVLSIPRLFLALLLVALYRPTILTTVLVLGGTTWMAAARMVRGQMLSLRERDYVQAARAAGARPLRLGLRHLLPAAAMPVLVEGALRVGDSILLEAALSFLGMGVPSPTPSWGNLVADGRHALIDAWWISTIPGLTIAVTVVAVNFLGDAARDRLQAHRLR